MTPLPGKALVTGGAGFLGGHLANRLAGAGWRVAAVDNLARGRNDEFLRDAVRTGRVQLIEADLGAADGLDDLGDDYTHIFHLAAIVGVQRVIGEPWRTLTANTDLVRTAIRLAKRQRSLERFVFASTSEVYAGGLETIGLAVPTPEDHPLVVPDVRKPRSSYAVSKLFGEALVCQAQIPYTIVRPHNVYGPRMGESHVVPELLRKAHEARPDSEIEVFSLSHRRTFCYVDDAIEMLLGAATSGRTLDSTLNLGSESPELSIAELAQIIVLCVGKPLRIRPGPVTEGSPARRCPDMSRMRRLTGCEARVPIEEGVRLTYDWYRRRVFDRDRAETAI